MELNEEKLTKVCCCARLQVFTFRENSSALDKNLFHLLLRLFRGEQLKMIIPFRGD